MSLYKDLKLRRDVRVILWRIENPEEELRTSALAETDVNTVNEIIYKAENSYSNINRRREWLAVRACMAHTLSRVDINYHSNGEPYLPYSNLSVAISHTEGMAAIAFCSHNKIGVDVQTYTPRILKLEDKICSGRELVFLSSVYEERIKQLSLIFSMKEALYKALDEPYLLYRSAFQVHPFYIQKNGYVTATFERNNHKYPFTIQYRCFDSFVLTLASV